MVDDRTPPQKESTGLNVYRLLPSPEDSSRSKDDPIHKMTTHAHSYGSKEIIPAIG